MKGFGIFAAGSVFGLTVGAACGVIGGLALAIVVIDDAADTATERIRKAMEGNRTV